MVEIVRKLIKIAVMAFIFPESDVQIAAGFGICFIFLLVSPRPMHPDASQFAW